jgi:hypothetical protein
MTIETLAEKYRLKVTRDECNDKIIAGRRGHLYIDAGKVCAMWLYARITKERLAPLGGHQWVGDYALDERRHRLRDAKVTGIPADKIPLAIRLTGTRIKREITEEERAVMRIRAEKARANSPIGKKKEPAL